MNEENKEQLEQDAQIKEQKFDLKPFIKYGVISVVILLVIVIGLYSLKSFTSSMFSGKSEKKEIDNNLLNSVDGELNLKDYKKENKIQELITPPIKQKEVNATLPPKPEFILDKEKKKPKVTLNPTIIKGVGATMVTLNTQSNTTSSNKEGKVDEEKTEEVVKKSDDSIFNDEEYKGDLYAPTKASMLAFDPNLTITKGSFLRCSLKTKLVSDVSGSLACILGDDVYSSNGSVLLLEKGSIITGSFKSANAKDDSNRMFVIWQEIRTPNNVVVPLFSGSTDELGGSGIEGYIDRKWALRFSSAILVSIIDDLTAGATEMLGNSSGDNKDNVNVDFSSTAETASEMATEVLKKFINIKPTIYKNQGDIVGIYVNRDIDFSSVYEIKRKR